MSDDAVRVARDASRLAEGECVRFAIRVDGVPRDAFALRWRGRLVAYVNTCRHQSRPLDFGDGRVLDPAAGELVCVHHGARYAIESGECVDGPCRGAFLTALALERRGDELWCTGRAPRA